ncbi:unnamed protein product, partial [Iphiclides podalirius]
MNVDSKTGVTRVERYRVSVDQVVANLLYEFYERLCGRGRGAGGGGGTSRFYWSHRFENFITGLTPFPAEPSLIIYVRCTACKRAGRWCVRFGRVCVGDAGVLRAGEGCGACGGWREQRGRRPASAMARAPYAAVPLALLLLTHLPPPDRTRCA